MKKLFGLLIIVLAVLITGCGPDSQQQQDARHVDTQQAQYAIGQPVPEYDWSLERDLVIQLYNIRNQRIATHSVWRSDYGIIEGDCPSMGYGIPYDTSLTNPLVSYYYGNGGVGTVNQPEPNGIFPSTNTSATWVMCTNDLGQIEPLYIETKVTVYPYPVTVDYDSNRVTKAGEASVTIKNSR